IRGGKSHTRIPAIKAARPQLVEEAAAKQVNEEDIRAAAIEACEQNDSVFIDEIDKVAKRAGNMSGGHARRAGVPRDLLPTARSATCCRWWKAPTSEPSTARSRPTTSCSSPRARSTGPSPAA